MTAKSSAAALLTLGTLVLAPAIGRAQGAPAAPPEVPGAAAPAEAAKPTSPAAPAPTAPVDTAAPAVTETPKPSAPPPSAAAPAPAPSVPAEASPKAPADAAPTVPAPPSIAAPAPGKMAVRPPEEVVLPARPVLSIEGRGAWETAEDKLGSAFERLAIAAKKAGSEPAGAPLVEYVESDEETFSFVVMLPIDRKPGGKLPKGIKVGLSPSGPALRFSPSPNADDLEEVYARIDDHLTEKGLTLGMVIEEYGEDAIASPEDRVVVDIYVFTE
ncbi:MAG: GyrI-like domain-containing protein [Siculibacillus sp.]|nr:GyrI-like domain-containing protein [Siculibacillus sp.]